MCAFYLFALKRTQIGLRVSWHASALSLIVDYLPLCCDILIIQCVLQSDTAIPKHVALTDEFNNSSFCLTEICMLFLWINISQCFGGSYLLFLQGKVVQEEYCCCWPDLPENNKAIGASETSGIVYPKVQGRIPGDFIFSSTWSRASKN